MARLVTSMIPPWSRIMSETIAGIPVPDSKLAREATDLLREHGTPLLYAPSLRVFLFGPLRGRHRGPRVDRERLYVGAVFHDFGLTPNYRSQDHRFEVDGANAAREFLRANGIGEEAAGVVWDAIALHTTPEIPWHKRPEIALVTGGVEADVLGDGLDEIAAEDRASVLAAYPRFDFKRGIVQAFADGFGYRPATTFGTMNTDVLERTQPGYRRPNFCDLIAANRLGGCSPGLSITPAAEHPRTSRPLAITACRRGGMDPDPDLSCGGLDQFEADERG